MYYIILFDGGIIMFYRNFQRYKNGDNNLYF